MQTILMAVSAFTNGTHALSFEFVNRRLRTRVAGESVPCAPRSVMFGSMCVAGSASKSASRPYEMECVFAREILVSNRTGTGVAASVANRPTPARKSEKVPAIVPAEMPATHLWMSDVQLVPES